MNRIYDIILTPNIVEAIKGVGEGKGVQLLDLAWQEKSVGNKDAYETCLTFSNFKKGTEIIFEKPEIKTINEEKE